MAGDVSVTVVWGEKANARMLLFVSLDVDVTVTAELWTVA